MGDWKFLFEEKDRSWVEHAACRGMGTEIFFPDEVNGLRASKAIEAAKGICQTCEVKVECCQYGIDEPYGVWGATSVRERRRARRGMR